ncbi:MAG: peptidylprolyl isomerase [bacterium]|nr:peptidylprolyl isomerase [bacterium]
MQINQNKVVSMHYRLTLDSGEMLDSSFDRQEPLIFLVGHRNVIPGLENELIGMESGDEKSIRVAPEQGYSVRNEKLVQSVSTERLPDDMELEEGKVLRFQEQDGQIIEAFITSLTDDEVTLDLNHPLAGEHLNFDIQVVDVREASAEELEHGHVH